MGGRRTNVARGIAGAWLVAVVACASAHERWAEVHFQGLSFVGLYHTAADLLDAEGFAVERLDPGQGTIESEWIYGASRSEIRGPARRKAFVRVEEHEGGQWIVRVRVAEEVIRRAGMLATDVEQRTDWEAVDDNYDEAELLAAKLRALLADHSTGSDLLVAPDEDGGS